MEYRHKITGQIIDQWLYDDLTDDGKKMYSPVYETVSQGPRDQVGDQPGTDDYLPNQSISLDSDDTDTSVSDDSGSSDDFQGFDGGDTGGGGASGDY